VESSPYVFNASLFAPSTLKITIIKEGFDPETIETTFTEFWTAYRSAPADVGEALIKKTVTLGDSDGDGLPDSRDQCPASDRRPTVVIDGCDSGVENRLLETGCTLADLFAARALDAKNHGQFASRVSDLTNDLKNAEVITGKEKGGIQSCAARANIP